MNPTIHRSRTRRTRRTGTAAVLTVGALALAACSGGGSSLQDAGNTTPTTAATTDSGGDATAPTAAPSTTEATPLADLPACPVDALAAATAPVELTFWHGMTAELEQALITLTEQYNASQDKVVVTLQNQGGYEQVIDKYLQSGQDSRPQLVQAPEYMVEQFKDTDSFIPVGACVEASGYPIDDLLATAVDAYSSGGVQWAMPFNVSNPILYYNRKHMAAAGLDPAQPPRTLEDVAAASQAIVESGAASFGLVVDTNFDSGGGWFIEQWMAKAGEFYADNDNGRAAPATKVLFNGPTGVELFTYLQQLVADGWAFNVGDNASGQDAFLKLADTVEPGSMTIGTSAALGSVLAAIRGGLAPDIADEDLGVAPMPGPGGSPNVLVGGASLWIVADKGDAQAAAAWDFITHLLSAESQATWAAATGYVPVHTAAPDTEPLASTYTADPRFRVAYDSLLATEDVPTAVGPLVGPLREIRVLTSRALATVFTGGDVQAALDEAATRADALIAEYNARQSG